MGERAKGAGEGTGEERVRERVEKSEGRESESRLVIRPLSNDDATPRHVQVVLILPAASVASHDRSRLPSYLLFRNKANDVKPLLRLIRGDVPI